MVDLLRETVVRWRRDNQASIHAAALAYYALFSLTPLLALVVIVAGAVLGRAAAQGEVVRYLSDALGPDLATTVEGMVSRASLPTAGIVPTLLSLAVLVYGATSIFGQLRASFDHVFGVRPSGESAVRALLRSHLAGLAMVVVMGILVLLSVAAAAALGMAESMLDARWPGMAPRLTWATTGISFVVGTTLVALLLRIVPDVPLTWRDVWLGAVVTVVLLLLGKAALGWYLARTGIASIYGAASSLVLLLLWIFYSAQILLLGATFTEVYSRRVGSRAP